jgi:hypothetical protein
MDNRGQRAERRQGQRHNRSRQQRG